MNEATDLSIYREALLFLVTAGVVAPLFSRLRVSPVLGYLLAGVALGPYGLGRLTDKAPWLGAFAISNIETIDRIAAFGVVFLLFTMGLELSFERLRRMRRLVFGFGLGQIVVTMLALAGIAFALGQTPAAALAIAGALAMSSTAIVIPVLIEAKRLGGRTGRATFAVLLFQDLAVAPLLVMVGAFAQGSHEQGFGWALISALGSAVVGLGLLIGLGRLALRPFFHFVAEANSPEFFMAACLLVVLGDGLLAAASHLSMALGAFIAGVLLAETEYRREIEVTIEPFRGLLLGLYFVSIGASVNPALIIERPGLIFGLAAALIVVKAAIIFGLSCAFGLRRRIGTEMALLLGPGGEFGFVMIGAAFAGGLIDRSMSTLLISAITISMVLIPALARLGSRISAGPRASEAAATEEAPPESDEGRVVIVGYGRVGALVGDMLEVHGVPYIAVDSNVRLVARARTDGKPVYYGDASRPDYLRRCGIDTARAVVVTLDNPTANEAVVATTRKLRQDITLVARARDEGHASTLYELGVTDAVPETTEASLQLSEAVLVDIGVPMGLVIASIHEKRDEYRKLLVAAGAPERRPRAGRKARKRGLE